MKATFEFDMTDVEDARTARLVANIARVESAIFSLQNIRGHFKHNEGLNKKTADIIFKYVYETLEENGLLID